MTGRETNPVAEGIIEGIEGDRWFDTLPVLRDAFLDADDHAWLAFIAAFGEAYRKGKVGRRRANKV